MCVGKAHFADAISAGLAVCSGFDIDDMWAFKWINRLAANAEQLVREMTALTR
jgi:hypothetical protein